MKQMFARRYTNPDDQSAESGGGRHPTAVEIANLAKMKVPALSPALEFTIKPPSCQTENIFLFIQSS